MREKIGHRFIQPIIWPLLLIAGVCGEKPVDWEHRNQFVGFRECPWNFVNSEQAKFLLRGYRLGGIDADNPLFRDALKQAAHDPMLAAWFERERGFDAVISARLQEVSPPAELREVILAGGRVTEMQRDRQKKKARLKWSVISAGVALIFLSATLWPARRPDDRALMEFALRDASALSGHKSARDSQNPLRDLLGNASIRLQDPWIARLGDLDFKDYRRLDWSGREIFETCFQRNGTWFHCYLAKQKYFSSTSTPVVEDSGRFSSILWTDKTWVYVVVSDAGHAAVEQLW